MALISSRQSATLDNLGLQSSTRARRGRAIAATLYLLSFICLLLAARSAVGQALSPGGPVDMGATPVGTSATSRTLPFTANVPTTISKVAIFTDGAQDLDFTVTEQACIRTLQPPASCFVTVAFKPTQLGLRRGALVLTDGNGAIANAVPLHGVGLAPQVVFSLAVSSATTTLPNLTPATFSPSSALYDGSGNLFVLDVANSRLLEQTPAQAVNGGFTVAATIPSLSALSSLAIAGDGTLFISSPNTGVVYSIAPGGLPTPLVIGVTLQRPAGLATDGYGYLYVSDNGTNRLLRVALDGSGTAVLSPTGLATPLSSPAGLAVDVNHNLYVADRGNNRIVRVSLNTGAASVVGVSGLTLSAPTGLVVDSAGTLDIADTGNSRLAVVPVSGGAFALPVTGTSLSAPAGVLLQPNGDLLVSDPGAGLLSLSRSSMRVSFPTSTKVGTTDTADGERSFTIQNTGSYALNLGSSPAPTISTGAFSVAGDSTCPMLPATQTSISPLGLGSTCTYSVNFKPTAKGVNNATLSMAFSAIGGSGSASDVTPSAALSGTGYTVLASFSVVAAPANTTLGVPVSVTVTALNNDGSIATDYTGTAVFTTTDPKSTFPGTGQTYTFTSADAGVHTFPAVAGQGWAFNSAGTFTVTATESHDSTITGTSNAIVVVNNTAVTLSSSPNPTLAGGATVLTATVSASAGTPAGTVTFLDGSTVLGTIALSAGKATLTATFPTAGTHTLTASYSGDTGFLPATSAPLTQTVEDFSLSLASGGSGTATIVNRGAATYSLLVAPVGGPALAGAVALSVAGLPAGFTGTFTPANVSSGAGSTGVALLVSGGRTAALHMPALPWGRATAPLTLAFFVAPLCLMRGRRLPAVLRLMMITTLTGAAAASLTGCLSDTTAGYYGTVPATQTLTVTATSGQLTHTLTLTLNTK